MCEFFSSILTYKNKKLLFDLDTDSHHEILSKNGIKDNSLMPKFVKLEFTPRDGDIFNHNIKNWKLTVDQDQIPDWYDEKIALRFCKKYIKVVWKKRFLQNVNEALIEGRIIRFAKNVKIEVLKNTKIGEMWGTSSIGTMLGTSIARKLNINVSIKRCGSESLIYDLSGRKKIILLGGKQLKSIKAV